MRKLLSLLLVVVMLFGLATTALAYTDVTATTQTGPVEKLSALGIIKGYADGTFKPENPITRAEFAAVIVRAMGLEEAAKLINTPTKFSDVSANYAWAYGYINIASAKGIIKGDPDGKFRPGDKVSFAEAITMLLRAGGWDAACSNMDWPAGFVMKAVEFGITDDVAFDAATAANRGAVAVMTYNALWMPMARWNDTSKIYENDKADLAYRYLNAIEKTVIVSGIPNAMTALKANQVGTEDGAMYVPAGVDPNAFLGREARVIKVGDKYVYMADVTSADDIIAGVDFVSATHDTIKYNDGDNDITLNLQNIPRCSFFVNNTYGQEWFDLSAGCTLTMFLDANGLVRCVIANKWTEDQRIVADKHVKGVDGETANNFTGDSNHSYPISDNTTFTKNGKPATFADLKIGDVYYVQADFTGKATHVELYDTKVTGKVSAVALNAKGQAVLTINATNYTVESVAFTNGYVTLNDSTITKDLIGSFVNFDATLKLNATGKALVVTGTTTALIGKVSAIDDENDKLTVSIKGVSNTYVHLAVCETAADGLAKGDYVSMTQRADGKVTSIIHFELSPVFTVKAVDTTNKALTLSLGGTLGIVKYAGSAFGVRLGTWGDASLLKTGDEITFYAGADSKILYFEVNPSFAGYVYGKYIGATAIEGTNYVYVNVKGEVKTYESTILPGAGLTGIVYLKLDSMGVATEIAPVVWDVAAYQIKAISGGYLTVERLSDHVIQVHDATSAVIYKADGSLGSLSDLEVGDYLHRVMNDTTVVVIQLFVPAP